MSLKSLKAVAALAGLAALSALAGCTCSGEPPGATGAGTPPNLPPPAETEAEAVPGIPSAAPRIGEAEEVLLYTGGSPRQMRRFDYPSFGASEYDVTLDLAEGMGDDIVRQAQLQLGVRTRIVKPLDRDGVRWTLEIIEATANDADGVDDDLVARARKLAPGLVGARAVLDNDKRGRWVKTEIEQGTPSGRRALATLLEAIEIMRGLSYTKALGPFGEWGHREVRRWEGIEVRQTVQYTITHLEDFEMDYAIEISRSASDVPAPGGGTVNQLVARGGGRATVRFDRVMPIGNVAVATTASIAPPAATAGAAGSPGEESAAPTPAGDDKPPGDANPDGADSETPGDGDGETPDDGNVVRRHKMEVAVTAREPSP